MWNLFDRPPRSGKLAKETVKHCVRALGRVYRDSELDDLLSMGQEGNHPVTYSTYVEALKKPHTEPEPGSLKAAVMAFDGKETGMMPEQLLLKSMLRRCRCWVGGFHPLFPAWREPLSFFHIFLSPPLLCTQKHFNSTHEPTVLSDGDEPMPAALCEEGMHGITFSMSP